MDLYDWFAALGMNPVSYKIIDGRVGTINGSTLTATSWGKTQVTADGAAGGFGVIVLEVRPKGAVAMPMVSAGQGYTLALKVDGTIWGWGSNGYGKLGIGTDGGNILVPTPVVDEYKNRLKNVVQISTAYVSSIAVKADGTVWTWGYNGSGQTGTGISSSYAMQVKSGEQGDPSGYLQNIISVIGGYSNVFAITATGEVFVWGHGGYGESGAGDSNGVSEPRYVSGKNLGMQYFTDVIDISASDSGTIFLRSNGTVFTCGTNGSAGLGDGTQNNYNYPVQVKKGDSNSSGDYLERIVEVTLGERTYGAGGISLFAMNMEQEVYAWGANGYYALGLVKTDGTSDTTDKLTPTKITTLDGKGVVHIAGQSDGAFDTPGGLAITADGKTYTWGGTRTNTGHLGNGTITTPHYVPTLTTDKAFGFVTVSRGLQINYVGVKQDGSVWSWGYNENGQTGIGKTGGIGNNAVTEATRVGRDDKTLQFYEFGQTEPLPRVVTIIEDTPLEIDEGRIIAKYTNGINLINDFISSAGSFTCSSSDKTIATVRSKDSKIIITPNSNKRYGETTVTICDADSTVGIIRVRVKPKGSIAMPMVSAGKSYTLALKADGTVWGWGSNEYGKLGIGKSASSVFVPTPIVDASGNYLENVVQISTAYVSSVALKADGTVWTWGWDNSGQTGTGLTSSYAMQVKTGEQKDPSGYLQNIIDVIGGYSNVFAITATGEVFVWGHGGYGESGAGDLLNASAPRYVSGLGTHKLHFTDAVSIVGSDAGTILLRANGTVFTCGTNSSNGGLGDDTLNNYSYPVQVKKGESISSSDYLENIVEVALGGRTHNTNAIAFFALNTDGEVYSWGYSGNYATGLIQPDGTPDSQDKKTPTKMTMLSGKNVVHIAGLSDSDPGKIGALAITADGKTYTWGGATNETGHYGNGTVTTIHQTPTLTTDKAFGLVTVSRGIQSHYAGTKQDGTVWAWGYNSDGQIGIGKTSDSVPEATEVAGKDTRTGIQVNGAAIYRGSSAAAAYGADAGVAGTQCSGELGFL